MSPLCCEESRLILCFHQCLAPGSARLDTQPHEQSRPLTASTSGPSAAKREPVNDAAAHGLVLGTYVGQSVNCLVLHD